MIRLRLLLFFVSFSLSFFLLFASAVLSNERWGLTSPSSGYCSFEFKGDSCSYPARTIRETRQQRGRENAKSIGGFYVDGNPRGYSNALIEITHEVADCSNPNSFRGNGLQYLRPAGQNYIDFGSNICAFRYKLTNQSPNNPVFTIGFEMNYDLDY